MRGIDVVVRGKTTRRVLIAGVVLAAVFGGWVLSQGYLTPKLYQQSQFLLDTFVEISVFSPNEHAARKAIAAAYAEIARIETLLSRYRSESQISFINQSAGKEQFIPVTSEVSTIVARALQYTDMTGGAFDITVGPLINAWGIGTQRERIPEAEELQQLLELVAVGNVELDPEQGIRLRAPEMIIDLGGIAKGYAIDRGIEVLREQGITMALINAGGDLRCLGLKADGTSWRIGIQDPRDKARISGIITISDEAVATSGDYERYFIRDGVRYHHIFSPETGRPVRECQSVTILAPTAEAADVMATAVFVMGPERGLAFMNEQPEIEGMIVRADGELLFSKGFAFQPK